MPLDPEQLHDVAANTVCLVRDIAARAHAVADQAPYEQHAFADLAAAAHALADQATTTLGIIDSCLQHATTVIAGTELANCELDVAANSLCGLTHLLDAVTMIYAQVCRRLADMTAIAEEHSAGTDPNRIDVASLAAYARNLSTAASRHYAR